MPDFDLRPDDYRKQNRWGRWYTPDDPKVLFVGVVFVAAMAIFVFVQRDQFSAGVLFGLAVVLGAILGTFVTLLMKHYNIN